MKKLAGKQKNCFIIMLSLIILAEVFLKINNMIIQSLGICLLPFILLFGFLLIKNDKKNNIN